MKLQELKTIASIMTFRGAFRDVLFLCAGLALGTDNNPIGIVLGVLATLMSFAELQEQHRRQQDALRDEFIRAHTMGLADARHKTVRL